uniref:Uncharacterized protein n=1 Tax=Trachymyrmex cornetzi TaxID=471704 RepID=A0A151J8X8_9HYME
MIKTNTKRGSDSGTVHQRADALWACVWGRDANERASPWFPVGARRLDNIGLETCRGRTAHSCRTAMQALLGFSIALSRGGLAG